MLSLTGKRAMVTGAAAGIGASIARTFATAGAHVVLVDCNAEAGNESLLQTRKLGSAEFLALDVGSDGDCERVAQQVGQLDILVNNAGIGHVGTILATTAADLDRLYRVNVRGLFQLCKLFLPGMLARKKGVIINIASVAGMMGLRDRLAYCTTKHAVVGLTKAMALDHAREGVRINCICPGRVETPFVQARLKEYPDPEKAYKEMSASQAVGRMGRPEEIAAAALYLASDEAAFITGSEFIIDGGMSAGL